MGPCPGSHHATNPVCLSAAICPDSVIGSGAIRTEVGQIITDRLPVDGLKERQDAPFDDRSVGEPRYPLLECRRRRRSDDSVYQVAVVAEFQGLQQLTHTLGRLRWD